jgi:hypothetical protein
MEIWGLSEEDSFLNEAAATNHIHEARLPKMIDVKTFYLRNVADEVKIYARRERTTPRTMGHAAVTFGFVGRGYLGWIRNVNFEEQLGSFCPALLGLR